MRTRPMDRAGRRIAGLTALASAVVALTGCPERADEITMEASDPAFNFAVSSEYVAPGGPFETRRLRLSAIDTSVTDAFDRDNLTNRAPGSKAGQPTFLCSGTASGTCPAWEAAWRNGTEDPRLPALSGSPTALITGRMVVIHDSVFGNPLALTAFADLTPSTEHFITLERLALTINEGLDASNVLLDNPVFQAFVNITNPDAPDELAPLDGTIGTSLGDNPYIVDSFTSSATGSSGTRQFFITGTGVNNMLNTAQVAPFSLPLYNYAVLYEGDPRDGGVPVMRAQFGVDLTPSGGPVNNGLGPFPTTAFGAPEMINLPGGAGRADSLAVVFGDLEELVDGAEYTAWLVNEATGEVLAATGTYQKIQITAVRDPITGDVVGETLDTVEVAANRFSFVGGDQEDGFRHELILGDAALPGGARDSIGFFGTLVLTIDQNPSDDQPGDVMAYWIPFQSLSGTADNFFDDVFNDEPVFDPGPDGIPDSGDEPGLVIGFEGSTRFGNFSPAGSRVFNGAGFGLGGIRENELSVDLEALSRPPIGFQFVPWLTREGAEPFRISESLNGPPPERIGLADADVDASSDVVTQTGILEANVRIFADEAGIRFADFDELLITLEPKSGPPAFGSIPVYRGELPDRVVSEREEQ